MKDIVDKKEVRILYCPTEKMLADFFTKPIQGELFRFFRNILMGYVSIIDVINVNDELKERVEKWAKYSHGLTSHLQNKNNNLKEKEKIDKREDLNKSPKNIRSENSTQDIRTYPDTCTDNRTYNNKKKSKRRYDLNKITGHVRGNADVIIGSGKIQKQTR